MLVIINNHARFIALDTDRYNLPDLDHIEKVNGPGDKGSGCPRFASISD